MSGLRVWVFGVSGLGGWVDLRLEARLDDIERAGDDSGKATGARTGEEFERDADVAALLVLAGPGGELLPEHELQGGEGEVSVQGGLVAVEEGGGSLSTDNGARSIDGASVVVARMEVRVVVPALEL